MATTVLDITTIIITVILVGKNYKAFTNSSLNIIHYTFVIFYVLPILLDYTLGFNDYMANCWGFTISREDFVTSMVYDAFVLYVQFVLVSHRRKESGYSYMFQHSLTSGSLSIPNSIYRLIWIGTLSAPVWMIINSASQFLFFFQWRELRIFDLPHGYAVAECLSYIGISCSAFLLFRNVDSGKLVSFIQRIIAVLLMYINICVEGKRSVMFFALCNIVVILLFNYVFRGDMGRGHKTIIRWGTSVAIILFTIYMISATFYTHLTRGGNDSQMTSARVDFLRDDRVRMAIYAEMNPSQMQITEHALQTIPDDLLSCFPLNFLASRIHREVVMYQTRFTCAMLGERTTIITDDIKEQYSYMTVSFLAEIISNLGLYLGLACIPFVLLWFVKLINQYPSPINILIFNSFFLLNLFDFSYVSYYIELTLLLIIIYNRNNK